MQEFSRYNNTLLFTVANELVSWPNLGRKTTALTLMVAMHESDILIHVSTVFSFCLSSCSSNIIYGLSCIFSSGTWRWWSKSRILFVDLYPFPSNEAGCEYDQVRFTGYKGYMLDDLRLRTTRMAGQHSHVSKHWHEMCTNTRHVRAGSLRLDQISLQLS